MIPNRRSAQQKVADFSDQIMRQKGWSRMNVSSEFILLRREGRPAF